VADRARVEAPAKANLFLHVLAREESGFHALETLFVALALADGVEVRRVAAAGIALTVSGGVDIGPPERNLAVRAAERFHAALGSPPALAISLEKRIPAAAGLGGGSSDAAAVLRALNAMHGEPFARAELLRMAIELGSDVPFFVCGSPFALAWGRGERLLALPPLSPRAVLVAHPGVAMSTADAFARLADRRRGETAPRASSLELAELGAWPFLAERAANDFEPVAVEAIPALAAVGREMRAHGAEIALLAGSGASYVGLFADPDARDAAGDAVAALGMRVWRTETRTSEPPVRLDSAEDGG
jgi:4-diphosphocytidyl-2-C-methyl-D-erythritol kinase